MSMSDSLDPDQAWQLSVYFVYILQTFKDEGLSFFSRNVLGKYWQKLGKYNPFLKGGQW